MTKTQVEECKSIDIAWLRQEGFLSGIASQTITWKNAAGEERGSIGITVQLEGWGVPYSRVRLNYTVTSCYSDESEDYDYEIPLTTTPCNFGGHRYWFICPLSVDGRACRRRVRTLYLPPRGKYFGCRHCYNLTYKSQQEHDKRVDALLKDPNALMGILHDKKSLSTGVALKAMFKVLGD